MNKGTSSLRASALKGSAKVRGFKPRSPTTKYNSLANGRNLMSIVSKYPELKVGALYKGFRLAITSPEFRDAIRYPSFRQAITSFDFIHGMKRLELMGILPSKKVRKIIVSPAVRVALNSKEFIASFSYKNDFRYVLLSPVLEKLLNNPDFGRLLISNEFREFMTSASFKRFVETEEFNRISSTGDIQALKSIMRTEKNKVKKFKAENGLKRNAQSPIFINGKFFKY